MPRSFETPGAVSGRLPQDRKIRLTHRDGQSDRGHAHHFHPCRHSHMEEMAAYGWLFDGLRHGHDRLDGRFRPGRSRTRKVAARLNQFRYWRTSIAVQAIMPQMATLISNAISIARPPAFASI